MIEKTLAELEARLQQAESVNEKTRDELLGLVETLRGEVGALSKTHSDEAQSIAGFTTISAHEALRGGRNPELVRHSLSGLEASVSGFEKSHPKLVEVVNRICTALSNMGI